MTPGRIPGASHSSTLADGRPRCRAEPGRGTRLMPELHTTVTPLLLPAALTPTPAAVDPSAILPFRQELWIPPAVLLSNQTGDASCLVVLRNKLVQLHPALGRSTAVWSYDVAGDKPGQWFADDGCLGPTLVVKRGQRVTITY